MLKNGLLKKVDRFSFKARQIYILYLDYSMDGGTGTFQLYRDNFRNVITSFARIILLIWAE